MLGGGREVIARWVSDIKLGMMGTALVSFCKAFRNQICVAFVQLNLSNSRCNHGHVAKNTKGQKAEFGKRMDIEMDGNCAKSENALKMCGEIWQD